MAFKLTKTEESQRDDLAEDLRVKHEELETASQVDPPNPEDLAMKAALFIVVLEEVEAFRDEIASRLRDEFDEKSDKWKEGDKAGEIEDMISEWENADFSDPGIDTADIDFQELEGFRETLEGLPTEV